VRARAAGRLAVVLVTGLAGLAPGACGSLPKVPYARAYPAAPTRGETLDIQVFRQTKHLELTNTTARAFGPSTLWLNARFSRPISGLGVGQSLRLRLDEFRDEYQDEFRGGGFFATELPDRLVLAELEVPKGTAESGNAPSEFLRLVVVGGEDE
jgi:hypothetical protein